MVISDVVKEMSKQLTDNARFEAELIVMNVLGITRTTLVIDGGKAISDIDYEQISAFVRRRQNGEPLQYILGETEFMSLDFYVEKGVLIPRSDTEILVETVLEIIENRTKILDICTGSGCIGISIAHYNKDVSVDLIDISDTSIKVAEKNITLNCVNDRVQIKKMDILSECPAGKYDVIVSNPPYIETEVIDTLQREVKSHEPHIALDGGEDGLVFYRRIIQIAPKILNSNGILAFEIGYEQGQDVVELMGKDFEDVRIIKDLNKNDRVVIGILR